MITILIPCAGLGTRFREAGYQLPKPMIDVVGRPMIQRVMDNLRPTAAHRFIIISRLTHVLLPLRAPDVHLVLPEETEGAVDTILKARHHLFGPLVVGNCDQLVDFDVDEFIDISPRLAGSLVTFKSNRPHHSYVITDDEGNITKIVEKQVISNQAVTGVYFFTHGEDFADHALKVLLADNDRYNGEFYVSSVIDKMIQNGRQFTTYDAPSVMLGTPDELQAFEVAVRVGMTL